MQSAASSSCDEDEKRSLVCTTPPTQVESREPENTNLERRDTIKSQGSGSVSIFRINVMTTFEKMVSLPKINVWNRLSFDLVQGKLWVHIRTSGFLFRRETDWMLGHCVLTSKGYLVVYGSSQEDASLLKGYAVSVASAKKLSIVYEKFEKKNSGELKKGCLVTVKWKFGAMNVHLEENQIDQWLNYFLKAFDVSNISRTGDHSVGSIVRRSRNSSAVPAAAEVFSTPKRSAAEQKDVMAKDNFNQIQNHIVSIQNALLKREKEEKNEKATKASIFGTNDIDATRSLMNFRTLNTVTEHEELHGANMDFRHDELSDTDACTTDSFMPSRASRSGHQYLAATLPRSLSHRHHSEGMLTRTGLHSRFAAHNYSGDRKSLLEWLNQVGAEDRFRRAKQYFESGGRFDEIN